MVEFSDKPFLSERLTFRLAVLAEEAISANDEIFVNLIGFGIREIRVLRLIDDYPGITFVEITQATRLERSLTSRIIRRLLEKGLVRRDSVSGDARRYQLSTTELGMQRRELARQLSDSLEEVLLHPLKRDELKALQGMLERLAQWVRSPDYRREIELVERTLVSEEKHGQAASAGEKP